MSKTQRLVVRSFRAAHGKPVSRKVVVQFVTAVGIYAVAFASQRLGFDIDPALAGIISGAIAAVAGLVAGYLVREFPEIVVDDTAKKLPPSGE